jgi:hypothetical protein
VCPTSSRSPCQEAEQIGCGDSSRVDWPITEFGLEKLADVSPPIDARRFREPTGVAQVSIEPSDGPTYERRFPRRRRRPHEPVTTKNEQKVLKRGANSKQDARLWERETASWKMLVDKPLHRFVSQRADGNTANRKPATKMRYDSAIRED